MFKRPRQSGDAQFTLDLVNLKVRAGQLGLYRTMHAIDSALQVVGWEIANANEAGEKHQAAKEQQAHRALAR